jgi:hypothetical protein
MAPPDRRLVVAAESMGGAQQVHALQVDFIAEIFGV